MLVMPWQPFFAVTLIGFCATSTCCAEQTRYASLASGRLHQSGFTYFPRQQFITPFFQNPWSAM